MLTNYLKIAFRNLLKNKLFSLINITGMAISLTSCFLIALFVWDELKFDNFHPAGDRTFRVYNDRNGNDGVTSQLPIVPLPFATYMQKDFPEIESTLRVMDTYGELLFTVDGKQILEPNGAYAEARIFDMLTIPVLAGSAADALEKPNTIALSESLAKKYFGEEAALGQMIKIGNGEYQVTAVFTKPEHFHLNLNFILSFATITKTFLPQRFENWINQQYFTYLKLKPGTDARILEEKFLPFVEKYAYPKTKPEGFWYVPHLQNIQDIHLHSSNFSWEIAQRGNAQTVYILSITGFLLLIIACLNFVNLSTARALKRMKEIGIRKVVGAVRHQLVLQFVSESVVMTLMGLSIAIVAAELTLPLLNSFAEKQLALPHSPTWIASVLTCCIALGLLAGVYPAFYLSRFRPAVVLYNKNSSSSGVSMFRQGLVILQFMFSFFLITGSMVVLSQNDLLQNKDMGFSKEQLVMIPLRSKALAQYETTKQEFSNHANILGATVGFGIPGDIIAGDGVIDPVQSKNLPTNLFCVDHDYIRTMRMHMVAGRDFSRDVPSDISQGFILNETASKIFGFETPEEAIGKPLHWNIWGRDSLKRGQVIGVVKDFHFRSLREKMGPVVMHIYPDAFWKLTVRIKPDNMAETIAHLKATYERLDADWPFSYKFVDENFDAMYRSEEKLSTLLTIFTGLAISVACFGLFGLVEYSVNQRRKEISIRKVYGAGIYSLVLLLTRNYFGLLTVAFVIIIPMSFWASREWLSNFAYHVEIDPWMFLQAGAIISLITTCTVSFQSFRAAWTNPAEVLKNE